MASSKVVFLPALLLLLVSMLAGTSVGTPGESCYAEGGYPSYDYPLAACHSVARTQCVYGQVSSSDKTECCRQLLAVDNEWCRCPALSKMLGIMHRELGVAEQGDQQAEVFPGCRRGALRRATATIPAFCGLYIPNVTVPGVCYWVDYTN